MYRGLLGAILVNIMRISLILFSILLFLPVARSHGQTAMMDAYLSSVMVHGYKANGGLAYGSGVVVDHNQVLTNCHTFRETAKAWVSRGDESYRILSVKADPWHDLCLLETDGLNVKPARIGKNDALTKSQNVISIGHSSGVPIPLTSNGTIKALYHMDHGKVIRTNARFTLGASGSGLFDTEGNLIGINTFKTGGRDAYYYAVPIEWLTELRTQHVETHLPVTGKAFWEETDPIAIPYFLQIANPKLNENWIELEKISSRWVEAESNNSDAWYEYGLANEMLGHLDRAEEAYRRSIELDDRNTDALFRTGLIAASKGDQHAAYAISMKLHQINKNLAAEYRKALDCLPNC